MVQKERIVAVLKQNELIEKTFSKEFVLVIQIYEQFSAFF
jgi:hypothetical protein